MTTVTPAQRRALRARAHHLDPVVFVGQHGLTASVLHEIDVALAAHELIKVRVFGDDRGARAGLGERICAALDCAQIQHLGKLLVLWRPKPVVATQAAPPVARKPRVPSAAAHERRRRAVGRGGGALTKAPAGDARPPKRSPLQTRSRKAPASPYEGDRPPRTRSTRAPKRPGAGAPVRPDPRFAPRGPGRKSPGASSATTRAPAAKSRRRRG